MELHQYVRNVNTEKYCRFAINLLSSHATSWQAGREGGREGGRQAGRLASSPPTHLEKSLRDSEHIITGIHATQDTNSVFHRTPVLHQHMQPVAGGST